MRTNGQVARAASALLLKHPDVNLTLFLRRLQRLKRLLRNIGNAYDKT
jgi:hypothetical protein